MKVKMVLMSLYVLSGFYMGCTLSPEDDTNNVSASFSFSPASPAVSQAVQFTDTSTGMPTSWTWSFGDGATSTQQNPSHSYGAAGSYSVSLSVANGLGSDNVSRTVMVSTSLVASFTYSPATPTAGQAVQFTDTTTGTPTSWTWSFGDGATSTQQNPSHSYGAAGSYSVSLSVANGSGSDNISRTVMVSTSLVASFTYSPATPAAGQAVQFTDTSTGTPSSWSWNFGDGGTSNLQNPTHIYAATGSKTVKLTVTNNGGSDDISKPLNVVAASAIIIDHTCAKLDDIPAEWINAAKQTLRIAYGHTSHGSQLTTGMTGLVSWKGSLYAWNFGGTGGALDLREWDYGTGFGSPDATTWAIDLGNPDRSAWAAATRQYLNRHPEINVIIWSWCWQMVTDDPAAIQLYLNLMSELERDFPAVRFVYMTGHVVEGQLWGEGTTWSHMHYMRAKQIRDYCTANNKVLYDFADIESWDPDGNWYGDKLVDEACNYDSNGDGSTDRNWAIDWQNAHPGEWYQCESAHSQPLNANLKAYAAWHLWARLAGWDGN